MEAPGASDLRCDLIVVDRKPDLHREASDDFDAIAINFGNQASSDERDLLQSEAPLGHIRSVQSPSDGRSRAAIGSSSEGGSRATKNHDQRAIVAQSSLDHGTIVAHSAKNWEPQLLQLMDQDHREIVAIKSCSQRH